MFTVILIGVLVGDILASPPAAPPSSTVTTDTARMSTKLVPHGKRAPRSHYAALPLFIVKPVKRSRSLNWPQVHAVVTGTPDIFNDEENWVMLEKLMPILGLFPTQMFYSKPYPIKSSNFIAPYGHRKPTGGYFSYPKPRFIPYKPPFYPPKHYTNIIGSNEINLGHVAPYNSVLKPYGPPQQDYSFVKFDYHEHKPAQFTHTFKQKQTQGFYPLPESHFRPTSSSKQPESGHFVPNSPQFDIPISRESKESTHVDSERANVHYYVPKTHEIPTSDERQDQKLHTDVLESPFSPSPELRFSSEEGHIPQPASATQEDSGYRFEVPQDIRPVFEPSQEHKQDQDPRPLESKTSIERSPIDTIATESKKVTPTVTPAPSSAESYVQRQEKCERICLDEVRKHETEEPVCGTDGATYLNKFRLKCTQTCRRNDLKVDYHGVCKEKVTSAHG